MIATLEPAKKVWTEEELQALDTALARFEQFLELVERAHDAEFSQGVGSILHADGGPAAVPLPPEFVHDPAKSVPTKSGTPTGASSAPALESHFR